MSVSNYVRSLDLSTAVTTTRFTSDGAEYTREAFISPVDQVLVVHFTTKSKDGINVSLTLNRQKDAVCEPIPEDSNSLLLKGQINRKDESGDQRGLSFAAQVKAITRGGKVNKLNFENRCLKEGRI